MANKYNHECRYCGKIYPYTRHFFRHLIKKHGINLELLKAEVDAAYKEYTEKF